MDPLLIGIVKEEKLPIERRVPLTPSQAQQLQRIYPHLRVYVESSSTRCFSDQSYRDLGLEVVDDLSHCDWLFAVKEVSIEKLMPRKTYFFFSHTAKQQPYNRELLRQIIRQKITLIDYEYLTDDTGQRQVAFGYYAGIVGAHNALWGYGEKQKLYHLPRAKDCHNYRSLLHHYKSVQFPPLRIVLTGRGRVSQGAIEILQAAGCAEMPPHDFLHQRIESPTYTRLGSMDYYQRKDQNKSTREDFYENPKDYASTFLPFAQVADLLIAGAYWDQKAPPLFTTKEAQRDDFSIRLIADITCDLEGSIPCTQKHSTVDEPLYDYDRSSRGIRPFGSSSEDITVMAVDNLPCELPLDASHAFGEQLIEKLFPYLLYHPDHSMIRRATIASQGQLSSPYMYLQEWIS